MAWTSRLTGKKRDIGHDEVKISVDRCLALEISVEQLTSENESLNAINESLNAANEALNGRITELQKQLDEARQQLKERSDDEEGLEELARVLRGFERRPEDLNPVPDEAAVENVKRLVENLDEQIDQTAASVTTDAIHEESPSKEETEEARARITSEMGAGFLDFLEDGGCESATASIHLRVGVQASLVHQCACIIRAFLYPQEIEDAWLWSMYYKIFDRKDNSVLTLGRWTSIVKQSIRDVRHELDETGRPIKAIEHVLAHVDSIMVVMGCSRQSAKVRLEANERVTHCVNAAIEVKSAMDKVISPILHVCWPENGESIGNVSESEEVDIHMNPVYQPTPSTALCSVALGLYSWEYDPAINRRSCKIHIRAKYISVLAAQTTRNTETRVIRNEVPGQSNRDKVSRASSNPVAG